METTELKAYDEATTSKNGALETQQNIHQQVSWPAKNKRLLVVIALVVTLFVITIIVTVFITKASVESKNADSSSASSSESTPKNLIVIISDGMGQTYNTAYRRYKNQTRTTIDKHFKGRYSTNPTNPNGITDSAAGATVFSCGVKTQNEWVGIDGDANPRGNILAAAKRQGKGTGIIALKSVTDATPSSFSAHSMYRNWHHLISKQQATRQINGAPMLDVLLGGGRRYFEYWGFFQNESVWHDKYGWNTVTHDATAFIDNLDEIDTSQMPFMGLFADNGYPYHLDRLNGYVLLNDSIDGIVQYPDLLQMSQKAVNLLSTKYEDEGFFLMVEASEVDLCGHDNDVACMLWEMEEFMETTEWILDWAENDGDTLVVMLSDHETGGLSIGRDGSYFKSDLVKISDGKQARDGEVAEAWFSFDYAYGINAPAEVSSFVENYGAYKWMPEQVEYAEHTAKWFELELSSNGGSIDTVDKLHSALERFYLGNASLTELEKNFTADAFARPTEDPYKAVAALMNARTLTGWTTHGHSGSDCAVYAFGPMEDEFVGHWQNFEIGQLLSKIFDVEEEQAVETEYLQQLFVDGELRICDPAIKTSYLDYARNVSYPAGNLLAGQNCVDEWIVAGETTPVLLM